MGHPIPRRRTNYAGIRGIQFGVCLSMQVSDISRMNSNQRYNGYDNSNSHLNIFLKNYFSLGGTIWMSEMDQMPPLLGLESDDAEAIYQAQ